MAHHRCMDDGEKKDAMMGLEHDEGHKAKEEDVLCECGKCVAPCAEEGIQLYPLRDVKDSQWMKQVVREHLVCVRQSPVAGLGVFATVDLKAKSRLAYYRGECMTDTEIKKRYGKNAAVCAYTLHLPFARDVKKGAYKRINIDALIPSRSNWTRFVNSCSGIRTAKGTCMQPNCQFTTNGILMTRRHIKAGDELFVSYGTGYTASLRAMSQARNAAEGGKEKK